MAKIWDRRPSKSEVIGRWGRDEKTEETTQNGHKVKRNKKEKKKKHL